MRLAVLDGVYHVIPNKSGSLQHIPQFVRSSARFDARLKNINGFIEVAGELGLFVVWPSNTVRYDSSLHPPREFMGPREMQPGQVR